MGPRSLFNFDDAGEEAPGCRTSRQKQFDEIWFENVTPEQCLREIRSQIARIHINLGHPRKQDLVRYLMLKGAKTVSVIAANAFRCASCLRTRTPAPGPPSTLPRALQFNDRLSMDIVYADDYSGKMHQFLGIFDKATWYHLVKI